MISIKSKSEIDIIREGGKLLAEIIKKLEKEVKPGIATEELDKLAGELVLRCGTEPSFKNYEEFTKILCVSINEELVHGVPSRRTIKSGDLVSLDLGMKYNGYHSDMATTLAVGNISFKAQRLLRVTKKALKRGIKKVRPGNTFGDIGNTIQRYVEDQGFGVVRDLCGHGIGEELHEEPSIPNYGKRGSGPKIKEGMVFCIEPMVTVGDYKVKRGKNGQTFETLDGSLSCHFEHTVVVTEDGCEVLTELR